mmetsp:Transcript_5236/g.21582  ORF Transcript_5236/g.21582 Transcript_5236/m.21582 type:complete len:467 (-) Transcript_5236:12-1412(-)
MMMMIRGSTPTTISTRRRRRRTRRLPGECKDVARWEEEEPLVGADAAGIQICPTAGEEVGEREVPRGPEAEVVELVVEVAALDVEDPAQRVVITVGPSQRRPHGVDEGRERRDRAADDEVEGVWGHVLGHPAAHGVGVRRARRGRAVRDDGDLLAAAVGEAKVRFGTRDRQRQPGEPAARARVEDARATTGAADAPPLAQRVDVEVRRAALPRRLEHGRVLGLERVRRRVDGGAVRRRRPAVDRLGRHVDERHRFSAVDLGEEVEYVRRAHGGVHLDEDLGERLGRLRRGRREVLLLLLEQPRRPEAVLAVDNDARRRAVLAGRRLDDADGARPAAHRRRALRVGDRRRPVVSERALLLPEQRARPERRGVGDVEFLEAEVFDQAPEDRVVGRVLDGPVRLDDELHGVLVRLALRGRLELGLACAPLELELGASQFGFDEALFFAFFLGIGACRSQRSFEALGSGG